MSQKVFTSMKDENPELQKQIGCISGFFQLFDRHRFLTGSSNNQNIQTKGATRNQVKEVNYTTQKATGKNVKVAGENQQFSTESSGTSMSSSSRSSSMSSLEFNRAIQIEPPSISPMKIPENSNSNPETAVKKHGNQCPQSLDFYDLVKESMHRDVQGLSVKIVAKEEKKGRILKHVDSPRPLELPKPVNMVSWDSPRLSYDGRDTQDSLKSATKPKELPRLSLDSREGSIKRISEGTKCGGFLKGLHRGYGSSGTMLKEPETARRSSSVVARLMGLETFPDCTETSKNESNAEFSTNDESNEHQSAASMKGSSTFLQFRRDASILNVTPYSRFSLEPTLWRQPEASQGSQMQTSKRNESSARASNQSLSVYGEIEKRIADIEFKNSGKDLRALKQILDAMQRYKESFDVTRDHASNSLSDNRSNSSLSESYVVKSPRIRQKEPSSTIAEMRNSTQGTKSPIFIMKPAKAARKTSSSASPETTRDSIGQNKMRTSKLLQSPKVPQVINGENATNSSNTTGAKSPRLQKKFGLERRSPTTSSSSESSSNRRQKNSTTPRKKFSETKNQRGDFKHEVGVEVIHIDQNNAAKDFSKESFQAEKIVTAEQPSPVSVLDAAFYSEEPPSPVKKKSDLDDTLYDSSEENSEDLLNNAKANFSRTIDTDLKTQNLVQILHQIDSNDERFTNFRNYNDPDHRYISEILLASGMLNSPSSSYGFHSSSHPINPKLFLALEKINTNKNCFNIEYNAMKISGLSSPEKMQRKLIFDVVSDILAQKLESSTPWCQSNQPISRKIRGQLLLDELCTEIDKLQHKNRNVKVINEDENMTSLLWEELMHCPTIYTNSYMEIPNVVLDIERLIFKDLITEVVRSELANHSGKHCRKLLFSK